VEDRISNKLDSLLDFNSTLLYEYRGEFIDEPGCYGTVVARWYGTDLHTPTVEILYINSFIKEGWSYWPEAAINILMINGDNGMYRSHLLTFAHPAVISQEQSDYRLPDSVFNKFSEFRTVYVIKMTYRPSEVINRCNN
jgi:hypothetical protein